MAEIEKVELETEKVATETKEEVSVIKPAEEPFEKHLYDCPMCHKKIKIHFDGCGCPRAKDIYTWTMKHLG